MFKNYLSVAWRNLVKNKVPSILNISGLAIGLAVALLIGLWAWDELTYNQSHSNHSRVAQVMQHQTFGGITQTSPAIPIPLKNELMKGYGQNFKYLALSSWFNDLLISKGDKHLTRKGLFMEEQGPEILALNMIQGSRQSLNNPSSILISQSLKKALFGEQNAMGETLKLNNNQLLQITGIYEDLPFNTTFRQLDMVIPWQAYLIDEPWVKNSQNEWGNNSFQMFAQIADNADINKVSAHIQNAKLKNIPEDEKAFKPLIFLHGMDKWHLYSNFKEGINTGGRIQTVWLFTIIGVFVLLLACINFMNLSTARSEKRSKEIGIRKAVGSQRGQLVAQFLIESLLITAFATLLAVALVVLTLPAFNQVADKQIHLPWGLPVFWLALLATAIVTGLIAGSYPALYLSSFQPVKILKGVFKAGRYAAMPRKVLVVLQFTVSVILITGTIIVFRQIQYAKNRPIGYTRAGLVTFSMASNDLMPHMQALSNELQKSGAISYISTANSPVTSLHSNTSGIEWEGKPPGFTADIGVVRVSHDYGKTVGWQFKEGRDFSLEMPTDSNAVIINEAAAAYMHLPAPITGKTIRWGDRTLSIIGVARNIVMQSPYDPVKQTIFAIGSQPGYFMNLRLNNNMPVRQALAITEQILKKYAPSMPFNYTYADEDFASKFGSEERIGKLAGFFALLAIFISCLGLFGMAAFMAEQRIREIGVRKVLGASVFQLWHLLSRDFMFLILIALLIATPIAWYGMHTWLNNFQYRTSLSWWIFFLAGAIALLLTLITVSIQSVKAAMANPVKSLKTE
ncbi:ABC-type antimicrobial peptide transport system permease subunit [Filimonas zeae]|nr:ABC transporter permease [Filimonas zeae]MDR6337050.1 ABC-type antimicrobial peptide transport system permease subunit [Filimonas zeae]